jgi:peptidyl-prolyl cis-trans isomerase A (cyclophilin A)
MKISTFFRGLLLAAVAQIAVAQDAPGPRVQFKTSMGNFTVELAQTKAPKSVENFLKYVDAKHYDGTVFHRVIDGFMIQGGGMNAKLQEKPTRPPIPLESTNGLKNERGTLAMARTNEPNSATAQFFVNVKDNDFLNYQKFDADTVVQTSRGPQTIPAGTVKDGYAVFGKVIEGMETIDKIRTVAVTNQGMHQNVPTIPVVIESARRLK